jgi:arylsulfatase A-like enzyme
MDLTASLLAASGTHVPSDWKLEGVDLVPILSGRAPETERTLYWRTNVGNRSQRAIRSGDWKLVVDGGHVMVFNLRVDVGERNDLANRRQDIARRLRPLLAAWERDVEAEAAVNVPQFTAVTGRGGAGSARGRGAGAPARGGGAGGRGGGSDPGSATPLKP